MGRPLKDIRKKKEKRIEIRLTEQELIELINIEKELSITRSELFIKKIINNSELKSKQALKQFDFITTELARIGNNVNQLARYCNTLSKSGQLSPAIINKIQNEIEQFTKLQKIIYESYRNYLKSNI